MHALPIDVPGTMRAARRLRLVTQRQLADRAGVPLSTVQRIEAGRSDPRVGTLANILAVLGVELHGCAAGYPLEPDEVRERALDAQGRHFPQNHDVARLVHPEHWWGWYRTNPKVVYNPPTYTYWKRYGRAGVVDIRDLAHRWQDAT
jgi:transcriptional regulator with XRE-family HTH domain